MPISLALMRLKIEPRAPQFPLSTKPIDSLAEKLNVKLHQWQPDLAEQVRQSMAEIIEMSDQNILDVSRSRAVEQEVLDLLDEPEVKSPNKRQSTSITSAILD